MFQKALTYDDVALIPQRNNIETRGNVDLTVPFTKNINIGMPLLAANMDTVISDAMADVLLKNGGMPIFHRFCDFETQKEWSNKYKDKCFISCGLRYQDQTIKLLDEGALGVVIDVAHGHSVSVENLIKKIIINFCISFRWITYSD